MGFIEIVKEVFSYASNMFQNIILLFAIVFIYGASNVLPKERSPLKQALSGLFIGGFACLIMGFPWKFSEGLIFDTRSVLFGVTALFFGPITTSIAAIIGISFRIFAIGGSGVYAGILTIITTSVIGLFWGRIELKRLRKLPLFIQYYIFGFFIHVVTVLCQFAIPGRGLEVVLMIMPVFIGLLPFATALLAITVHHQDFRLRISETLRQQRILLQASIDSPKEMEIYAIDSNYNYLSFNRFHKEMITHYYHVKIDIGMNYLKMLVHSEMAYRIKTCFDMALKGETFTRIDEVEDTKGKYLENFYAPIYGENGKIIGATIFTHDITERKKYEQSILYLSYHDVLTGLKNRRFYQEEMLRMDDEPFLPLSVVMADINGLKIMNDAFGHDAGDALLKIVATELQDSFKGKGEVARIGGDEFVIMLERTDKGEATNYIYRAKKRIEKHHLHGMTVSVSFGVETKTGTLAIDEVIKLAEDDMYKHKLFEVTSNRHEAIEAILNTLHLKNSREEAHSRRVAELCQRIGESLGMRSDEIKLLGIIGNMHDIGKIGIPEHILNKPGALTEEEWIEVKRHSEIGYRIVSSSSEYIEFSEVILSHHERWDGKGYPQGISGSDIPLRARIIAIADTYDAMTSDRPYRPKLTHEEAIAEIRKHAGTQFDPMIAKRFVESFKTSY
ncbi:MAG: diguanylate cyclase [Candidatus Izemoplasmatales bacterium]|nr:diguanylate cyclase [Candidatus Izemoplasmatales bacterium]